MVADVRPNSEGDAMTVHSLSILDYMRQKAIAQESAAGTPAKDGVSTAFWYKIEPPSAGLGYTQWRAVAIDPARKVFGEGFGDDESTARANAVYKLFNS